MSSLLLPLLVGLVPVTAGAVLVLAARRGTRPRPTCGACGCDVGALDGRTAECPSCDASLAEAGIVHERPAPRTDLLAGAAVLIVLGAGCFGGAVIAQRASERGAQQAEAAAREARDRANAAIEARIAEGRAEALENPATQPQTQPAPEEQEDQ